jgi:uncharacterized NAD-dependent epimerase/dehydratase family protein
METKMYHSQFPRLPLRAVLFADGVFAEPAGKTAHGIIRHSTIFEPVAIVDRALAPADSGMSIPGIPIVASVEDAAYLQPEAFIMALTESDYGEWSDGLFVHLPRTPGDLPEFWMQQLSAAATMGLHIISCLHFRLAQSSFRDLADPGQQVIDIRAPYHDVPKYSGRRARRRAKVVHIAGSDCVVGKRTAALQLHRSARELGINSGYIGTGQTCLLVGCDEGAIIDRTPVCQAAGLVERLIEKAEPRRDLLFIKGQASVLHPAFGGLATAILQGSQPDAVVFVHDAARTRRHHWEHLPVGNLAREIELVQEIGNAPVVAVATRGSSNVERLRSLSVPVADPITHYGARELLAAVLAKIDLPPMRETRFAA